MGYQNLPSRRNDRVHNGQGAPSASNWSVHVPALTAGVAIAAWILVLLFQILSGFEWNRTSAVLGLLLPICALAPFSALIWKKKPHAPPVLSEPTPKLPEPPPRHLHLANAPLDSIPAVLPLWRLFERMSRTGRTDYPVVDESGHLIGIISHSDLPPHSAREVLGWLVAADVMRAPRSAA